MLTLDGRQTLQDYKSSWIVKPDVITLVNKILIAGKTLGWLGGGEGQSMA